MRPWQFVSSSALHPRGSVARALAPAFAWACLGVALSVAPSHAQFFNAVYSRDALDVVAVADSGSLYRSVSGGAVGQSTEGGATWSAKARGTSEQLNAVRFVDGQNGWVAGANGYVARTTNGGTSWTPVGLGTGSDLNGVDAKGSAVWVVGDN